MLAELMTGDAKNVLTVSSPILPTRWMRLDAPRPALMLYPQCFQSSFVAILVPATSASSFAQTMASSISLLSANDAKPQSVDAITFSRPTNLANRTIRSATSRMLDDHTRLKSRRPESELFLPAVWSFQRRALVLVTRVGRISKEWPPARYFQDDIDEVSSSSMSCTRGPMLIP